jgi:hypothetical protein
VIEIGMFIVPSKNSKYRNGAMQYSKRAHWWQEPFWNA